MTGYLCKSILWHLVRHQGSLSRARLAQLIGVPRENLRRPLHRLVDERQLLTRLPAECFTLTEKGRVEAKRVDIAEVEIAEQ